VVNFLGSTKSGSAAVRRRSSSRWVNTTRQHLIELEGLGPLVQAACPFPFSCIGRRGGNLEKIRERWNMGQTGFFALKATRHAPGLRQAVFFSVLIHGLLALVLWLLPGNTCSSNDHLPLAEIPVTIVPVEQFTLSLASEKVIRPAAPPPAETAAESEEPTPILVQPLPIVAPPLASDSQAPQVQGSATGAFAGQHGESTNGPAGGRSPTFFGAGAQARRVIFLVDRSISMGLNGGLGAAKKELLACLQCLPLETRFQVLFYNRTVERLDSTEQDGLLTNTPRTRTLGIRRIETIQAQGGTDHLSAVRAALALEPELILLATDGDGLTMEQVRTLTQLNRHRTVIDTLAWGHGSDGEGPLQALAQFNRGSYRRIRPGARDER
jgi:hypothetical protein